MNCCLFRCFQVLRLVQLLGARKVCPRSPKGYCIARCAPTLMIHNESSSKRVLKGRYQSPFPSLMSGQNPVPSLILGQVQVPSLLLVQIPVPSLSLFRIAVTKSEIPYSVVVCKLMCIINCKHRLMSFGYMYLHLD